MGNFFNWGIAVVQTERTQFAYGPGTPVEYFLNPLGIFSIILSAEGLQNKTDLTVDSMTAFSININLAPAANYSPIVTFPLVQGMPFVTAIYNNSRPIISSTVTFVNLTYGGVVAGRTVRYTAALNDAHTWLIYVTPHGNQTLPVLTLFNSTTVLSSIAFSGTVQVAKNPSGDYGQQYLDQSAGVYPVSASISGSVVGSVGIYIFSWIKGGVASRTLLMYALPHHVSSFSSETYGHVASSLQLQTTTKGIATAVYADSWTMIEGDIPDDMKFAPWSPISGSRTTIPAAAVSFINKTATSELSEDMDAQTNLNSMYYAGKVRVTCQPWVRK